MREGDVYGLEGKVQKLCKTKVSDLDCECLWESAGDAFTLDNASDILDILADRRRWTGQITRARIKKVSDEKSAGLISRSLYQCTPAFLKARARFQRNIPETPIERFSKLRRTSLQFKSSLLENPEAPLHHSECSAQEHEHGAGQSP